MTAAMWWTEASERALANGGHAQLQNVLNKVDASLALLADSVLQEQPAIRRQKIQILVRFHSRIRVWRD